MALLFYGHVEPYGTLKLDMTQLSKNPAHGDSLRSSTPIRQNRKPLIWPKVSIAEYAGMQYM